MRQYIKRLYDDIRTEGYDLTIKYDKGWYHVKLGESFIVCVTNANRFIEIWVSLYSISNTIRAIKYNKMKIYNIMIKNKRSYRKK